MISIIFSLNIDCYNCGFSVNAFKTMEEMVRIKHLLIYTQTTVTSSLLIITGLKSIIVNCSCPIQNEGHLKRIRLKWFKHYLESLIC